MILIFVGEMCMFVWGDDDFDGVVVGFGVFGVVLDVIFDVELIYEVV